MSDPVHITLAIGGASALLGAGVFAYVGRRFLRREAHADAGATRAIRAFGGWWSLFALATLLTLAVAGVIGLMTFVMMVQPGFLGMAHFADPRHRTHELTFGFLFGVTMVGMLVQLRRPLENVAAMLMALIPWAGLALTLVFTLVFASNTSVLNSPWVFPAAATVIAMLVHPAGADFFRSFTVSRVNRVMLALAGVAAVPLLVFAIRNLGFQGTVLDVHAAPGHYGFMAAFALTVIGVSLLASLRPDGWRLTAWVAGLLPALLGVTSLAYPDATSSLGLPWALAAIGWGALFVTAAVLERPPSGDTEVRWTSTSPGR
jgi:hypothetical protein